jgi:hypothetical protein
MLILEYLLAAICGHSSGDSIRRQLVSEDSCVAGAIMIGALFTLVRNREPFRHLALALVFSALIVITLAARG